MRRNPHSPERIRWLDSPDIPGRHLSLPSCIDTGRIPLPLAVAVLSTRSCYLRSGNLLLTRGRQPYLRRQTALYISTANSHSFRGLHSLKPRGVSFTSIISRLGRNSDIEWNCVDCSLQICYCYPSHRFFTVPLTVIPPSNYEAFSQPGSFADQRSIFPDGSCFW